MDSVDDVFVHHQQRERRRSLHHQVHNSGNAVRCWASLGNTVSTEYHFFNFASLSVTKEMSAITRTTQVNSETFTQHPEKNIFKVHTSVLFLAAYFNFSF